MALFRDFTVDDPTTGQSSSCPATKNNCPESSYAQYSRRFATNQYDAWRSYIKALRKIGVIIKINIFAQDTASDVSQKLNIILNKI